ncbi:unnamed protein product [Owenia fusiformis]|uniref:S1-like domain-containing protein n=1 Tax=Owenia fusiformis TaxID=6347 RepID=A0A8S4Q4F3_OWEFU|nr:unnamed protein product [Owenia fusiformis]
MSQNRGRRERIRRDKNENDKETRELVFKKEGQEYAQVVKMLGNGRVETNCFDGTSRLAYIREEQRKKANVGDILLLQLRDYRDAKADVIFVYTLEEAINLKAYGELTETDIKGTLYQNHFRCAPEK